MRCWPQRCISPRRWSSMSDRAYACVMAFPSSWARASSLAAQSAPFSRAQEQKVALNPCRVVSSPAVRNASAIVLWWMIRPRRDGNTRLSDAGSVRASSSTARAAVESGTRCGRRIFVRSVGIAHSAASRSISDQRAPRVSLERVVDRRKTVALPTWRVSRCCHGVQIGSCHGNLTLGSVAAPLRGLKHYHHSQTCQDRGAPPRCRPKGRGKTVHQ